MSDTAVESRPKITLEIVAEHGLNEEEYARILAALGREPNLVELGIFSVMWSEHCSYKSSRRHLKKLPTEGPQVICGPGENAGVIDIGDGQAAIFKMESHNHPSFIEPYQGAATGVGGILRDVFTMGARAGSDASIRSAFRPIRIIQKHRHLVSGVVARHWRLWQLCGRSNGRLAKCTFDRGLRHGNILVNAMTCRRWPMPIRCFMPSRLAAIGNPVVYVGCQDRTRWHSWRNHGIG